jgi:hypothetical protein
VAGWRFVTDRFTIPERPANTAATPQVMHVNVQRLHGRLCPHDGQVQGFVRREPETRHASFEAVQKVDRWKKGLMQPGELVSGQVVLIHVFLAASQRGEGRGWDEL